MLEDGQYDMCPPHPYRVLHHDWGQGRDQASHKGGGEKREKNSVYNHGVEVGWRDLPYVCVLVLYVYQASLYLWIAAPG